MANENKSSFIIKLTKVQSELKAPKNQRNNFGNYNYRSCEDIVESVKPLLAKQGLALIITDDISLVGDRYYVKATATITDGENEVHSTAYAREPWDKKGMDESQITGSSSSYARKYALNGLLAIDDTKDADSLNTSKDCTEKTHNAPNRAKNPSNNAISKEDGQFQGLDPILLKECQEMNIDLEKVKAYYKKDTLTNVDLYRAINQKKDAMEQAKGNENE